MIDAIGEAHRRMDGVVLLGAEINFAGSRPEVSKASIDWTAVKRRTNLCSIALRVSPYSGPFRADDPVAQNIIDVSKELINDARIHGVALEEFQFDFDCAQKNLGGYRTWLRTLRMVVRPTRFVITALPAWLDDPQFPELLRETDSYVLQVHSVPLANASGASLCNTALARQWIDKAAKLGQPFSIALPTYRCSAGYGSDGKLLSVAMDSVQPVWPPGTHILEFTSNADEIASLLDELIKKRPKEFRDVIWYRIPIATDTRNWRWVTLDAVMAGRHPKHKLDIVQEGTDLIDLSIFNAGESDEQFSSNVMATWKFADLTAADALSGWNVRSESKHAVFSATGPGVRLPPGASRKIGWLRFDQPTNLEVELSKNGESFR